MGEGRKYQVLVCASSEREAIEIASEGLSVGATVVRSEVEDVSEKEGADSYFVTLWFTGGKRSGSELE